MLAEFWPKDSAKSSGCASSPKIRWEIAHPAPSFDHVDCIANVPVEKVTFRDAPVPVLSHAHLSAFSSPLPSNHPNPTSWSVIVSEYSWPSTIVTPSSRPDVPALTKFSPQLFPTSGRYGRFVNAIGPDVSSTVPWEAQKPPPL